MQQKQVDEKASIPIKEQLLLLMGIYYRSVLSFNSYKGTIVICKLVRYNTTSYSFNSYKGTIVIKIEIRDSQKKISFNSYKGTIVIQI